MKNYQLLFLCALFISGQLQAAKGPKYNQTSVIVGGSLLNIFRIPEELFWLIKHPLKLAEYEKSVGKTKKALLASGDASDVFLTCEERCHDDFRILQARKSMMIPDSGKNLLSFLNEKSDFKDHIQRTVGYCWGHTSVTRNFNYLAYFDPSSNKISPREYRKIIRRIMKGKAQIIPGFENLREFSADPEIKKYLKDQVVWNWLNSSLRIRSANVPVTGFKGLMSWDRTQEFLIKVQKRLDVNHAPKVFFTNLKKPGFIHVVSVYEVREENSEYKLCILDNHEYEEDLKDCGVHISLKKDGSEYYYEGWDDPARDLEGYVGQFGFTPEDKHEMLQFRKANTKMCLKLCSSRKI